MTLHDAIAQELPFLRAEAIARMTDACRVTIPGPGTRVLDPVTLEYVDPPPVVVYEGPCRLGRVEIPHVSQAVSGEATWDTQDAVLHLPFAATETVVAGATVTYLTSSMNPALVGKVFGVVGVVGGTQLTARRCLVREVVDD